MRIFPERNKIWSFPERNDSLVHPRSGGLVHPKARFGFRESFRENDDLVDGVASCDLKGGKMR